MPGPRPLTILAPVLAAALLALGGCGAGTVHLRGNRVAFALSEYRIVPQNVSMPAGTIVIVARNEGILTHDLSIELPAPRPEVIEPVMASTGPIRPGASATLTLSLHRPGRYEVLSTIANQGDLGMNGTLTIRR